MLVTPIWIRHMHNTRCYKKMHTRMSGNNEDTHSRSKFVKESKLRLKSSYHPISKLAFTTSGKKSSVYWQISSFVHENCSSKIFQSGFKSGHSSETALINVFNDILSASNASQSVVLLLLDRTAAFDWVVHQILLSDLKDVVGIRGRTLFWFKSYSTTRGFSVQVGDAVPSSAPLFLVDYHKGWFLVLDFFPL